VKTRRSPSSPEHLPHVLRRLIDDLWLTGVVHLGRIQECDAKASEASELHARSYDIWRTSLAIAYWLQEDHGVRGLFDRITAISMAYQQQVQDVQGMDLIGLVLNALNDLLRDSDSPTMILPTADILRPVREHAQLMDQDGDEVQNLTPQRLGKLLGRIGFEKSRAHGSQRSWQIGMDRMKEIATRRSHVLPRSDDMLPEETSSWAEEQVPQHEGIAPLFSLLSGEDA
jgi:hypothetical protein